MYTKGNKSPVKESVVKNGVVTLEGQVTRMHDGENKLVYSMDVPITATSTKSMDDALVNVTDNGALYMAYYMDYEGGRGYSALDYIHHNITPKVRGLVVVGTTTIRGVIWTVAETANSEWHVGQVGDGQWIMVVESKKALHDKVMETLGSLTTK